MGRSSTRTEYIQEERMVAMLVYLGEVSEDTKDLLLRKFPSHICVTGEYPHSRRYEVSVIWVNESNKKGLAWFVKTVSRKYIR